MEIKKFEKNAKLLLKYGIGENIEESRKKLQLLINAQKRINKHNDDNETKRNKS